MLPMIRNSEYQCLESTSCPIEGEVVAKVELATLHPSYQYFSASVDVPMLYQCAPVIM